MWLDVALQELTDLQQHTRQLWLRCLGVTVTAMSGPSDPTLLHRYHTHPGRTVAMLEHFRDMEGRSSYEVLAEEANALPREGRVLDLACGDGYLLAMLAARGFCRLIGVDQSPHELAAAHERLGEGAELHCHDACALPLPVGSVDMVVCHMALMLMESAPSVLTEIARVLKPGRLFVAVINRPLPDPAWEVYRRELRRITAEAGMSRLRVGCPDIYTEQGVRELFRGQPFNGDHLHIRDFVVRVRVTPRRLWSMFELMYDVFRLPTPEKEKLVQRLLPTWASLADESGLLTAAMGMRLLKCPTLGTEGAS